MSNETVAVNRDELRMILGVLAGMLDRDTYIAVLAAAPSIAPLVMPAGAPSSHTSPHARACSPSRPPVIRED